MASSALFVPQPNYTEEVESTQPAAFTPIEWLVIAIAQRDGLRTLREPSRLALALGSLFGSQSSPSLADPRLEILRQCAVLAVHQMDMCATDRERFIEAGFSTAHHVLLLASLARAAAGTEARRRPAPFGRRTADAQPDRVTLARF